MRILYSMLVAFSTPFVLLYFAVRGLRDRAYLARWGERFGFVQPGEKAGGILLHAASVGEYNAASPLIEALLKRYPDLPLIVTTLTPTGSERVSRDLGARVFHAYIPLDLPAAVSRFLSRTKPQLIIVMETEIWPNLYLEAHRRDIPLLIANARLSATSIKCYQRVSGLARNVLQPVAWIGAQSTEDAERMILCGALPQHTAMTGNLKFDLQVPASLLDQGKALRSRWNPARPVLVAGSTHEADEDVILPAFKGLLESTPDALLILVPRHPERFTRTVQAARAAGLRVEMYSEGETCSELAQCFVVDAMGKLMAYYACADVTFVGGSMGEQGGHNTLEPASLGKPVMVGPNTTNAKEIVAELIDYGAAVRISNPQSFQASAEALLGDGFLRDRMGQAGLALIEKNKGALDLTLDAIDRQLSRFS
ncbi:MAG: lipid IV(A) 3-deoxy-D-manno-octulosonic acid transferase [Gammaproteobacteria bacterium]|nr:MAG: lipid IV(A) 3-deoxy-D-manno-octulosonic acid transferase [Gammaproteobacteria bacterium]